MTFDNSLLAPLAPFREQAAESNARLDKFFKALPPDRIDRWRCVVNMHHIGSTFTAIQNELCRLMTTSEQNKNAKTPRLIFDADALNISFRRNLYFFNVFLDGKRRKVIDALKLAQQGYDKLLADGCLVKLYRQDVEIDKPLDFLTLRTLLDNMSENANRIRWENRKGDGRNKN